MGCKFTKTTAYEKQEDDKKKRRRHDKPKPEIDVDPDGSSDSDSDISQHEIKPKIPKIDETVNRHSTVVDEFDNIEVADPEAFNQVIIQQRQQAVKKTSYQSVIESWQPKSLPELAETIKIFSKGKSLVDRHWIIFYWVAFNIEYDTVSYFSKDYKDQSAEGVFRRKKGVCAGYANIYKYLCDQLKMPCEVVSGYAKGYGFDDREGAPTETNHAWNAVEIYNHWYLMESTWGAGNLNEQKVFKRQLNTYYFLPRPNEMIYHHLPKDDKWQLLRTPIKMSQYMQMPKLRPLYFEFKLEMIQPRNRCFVKLEKDKSFALVVMKAPTDIFLIADLKLHDQKIEGGDRVIFDKRKRLFYCHFAPANMGKHKITIYGRRGNTEAGGYNSVLELTLDVKQMPTSPISFPETWENYFNLGLEVVSPRNTHLIKLNNGETHTQIQIRTTENVELLGRLENENGQKVENGNRVYFDRQKNVWRCNFAPDRDGVFKAIIMAKKKSDPGSYSSAVAFKIEAKQVPSPCLSYPYAWPLFYDLGLKVEAPKNTSNAVWSDKASFAEVLIKAPEDVELSCDIEYDNIKIENGSLAQFDNAKRLWQCLFAPERTGRHELVIYAKRNSNNESSFSAVIKLNLNVTKIRRPMKFPVIYTQFQTKKCQIYTPRDGILKKDSIIPIHCVIPGAMDVNLKVDSKWLETEGYKDPILQRKITVGSKEVVIYGKYGQESSYHALVKYSVQ